MSKLVLLSDIHGNGTALRAATNKEGPNARYVVLGDLHGLNAMPSAVMSYLASVDTVCMLAGNHDRSIFHEGEGHVNNAALSKFEYLHTVDTLSHEDAEVMRSLPYLKVWQEGAHRICAAHAWPYPEQASGYEQGNSGVRKGSVPMVAASVSDDYDYVFLGHTHEQYDVNCAQWGHDVHFVNPGSLGYDGTYSVVDTETGHVEHKSVEWDKQRHREYISALLPDDCPSVYEWL